MSKKELRMQMMESVNAAGDVEKEKAELRKVQQGAQEDVLTITVTCSGVLTLICC